MTATGQVTMRTRDRRMARTGTRTIPRRTHCMERDTQKHTVTGQACWQGSLYSLSADILQNLKNAPLRKCTSLDGSLENTQRISLFVVHTGDLHKPISGTWLEIMGLCVRHGYSVQASAILQLKRHHTHSDDGRFG